ncbi:MAG: twin-arginine translocation signal domain-containing protein [Anaerolineae bacterium]|nr:twin-arginine translocation signal domain-containing protein [Anaerolineae bacterium]
MSKVNNISRRTFLKGAGAVAASSLLPHFPNIVRADNHEINIIGWGSDFFDGLFEGATEATGININHEGLPSRWSDVMHKQVIPTSIL